MNHALLAGFKVAEFFSNDELDYDAIVVPRHRPVAILVRAELECAVVAYVSAGLNRVLARLEFDRTQVYGGTVREYDSPLHRIGW